MSTMINTLVTAALLISISVGSFGLNLGLGRNHCLRSRLEHVPCQYRRPHSTKVPGPNEIGDYQTRYNGRSCHILRRRHRIRPILRTRSDGGSVSYIFSPGKTYRQPQSYQNQKLVYYNVNCEPGQYIYFNLLDMNIEDTKCFDESVNSYKCVDYLQVRTPNGNIISDNCGRNTTLLDNEIFPFDSIQVTFRSNIRSRYPGFSATATCFTPNTPTRCQSEHRQRRYSSKVDQSLVDQCLLTTHEKVIVPYGHEFVFQGTPIRSILSIINKENQRIIQRWTTPKPVRTLYMQSMNSSLQKFQYSAREHRRHPNLPFPPIPGRILGPGVLFTPKKTSSSAQACYQRFLVNVTEFIPNETERALIGAFLSSLNGLVERENSPPGSALGMSVPDKNSTESSNLDGLPSRQLNKRSVSTSSLYYRTDGVDNNTLMSAMQRTTACNPILKISATALLNEVQRDNPERLEKMKNNKS